MAGTIDRDQIIETALLVMDVGGVNELSVRGLAEAIRGSRSSIYRTFGGREGLMQAAIEQAMRDVPGPAPPEGPEAHIRLAMARARETLLRHPCLLSLLVSQRNRAFPRHGLELIEMMKRLGLGEADAMRAALLLTWTVVGSVRNELAIQGASSPHLTAAQAAGGRARRYRIEAPPEYSDRVPETMRYVDCDEVFALQVESFVAGLPHLFGH